MSRVRTVSRGWVLLACVLSVVAGAVLGAAVARRPEPAGPRYYSKSQVLVSADGMMIAVAVDCDAGSLEATETATSVTLRVPTLGGHFDVCGRRSSSARLKAPLGNRTLIDAMSGHPLPVFSGASVLRPIRLPVGFTHAYDKVVLTDNGLHPIGLGCVQVYVKDGEYENTLLISQMVGPAPVNSASVSTTPVIVRGQLGTATPGQLAWSENGQVFTITSNTYAYTMLTTAGLVAIGDSLR